MRACFSALVAGLLSGVGLVLSEMVDPARVLGFFDVFGRWDPTLAFVMGGGLAVSIPGLRWATRHPAPLCAEGFSLPAKSAIDGRLLGGATLFGIGWGLVGMCPGPAIVLAAAGVWPAVAFVAAMAAGMVAWRVLDGAQGRIATSRMIPGE